MVFIIIIYNVVSIACVLSCSISSSSSTISITSASGSLFSSANASSIGVVDYV